MPVTPRDLTIPEPGSTTARDVLSRAISRALRDLSTAHRLAPPGARAEAAVLQSLVRETAATAPGALASVMRRPTTAGLLRCLRNPDLPRYEEVFVALVAQLAFELHLAGALSAPPSFSRAPAQLFCIPARLPENAYHPLTGSLVLALADNNPLAMTEAHPDKAGNAIDLGGHPVSEWVAELSTALDRIARYLPDLRAEMDLHLSQIIPVGYDPEEHLSASYQEILGTVYLSLHPSSMTLSEALIHEFSHNKLNALFEVDAVLENAWSPLYTSPVRPDPRPLHGVLLAVHAFLPVARLYEQMIASGDPEAQSESFRARFAEVRRINREGAELLLDKGRPSKVGRGLFDEIQRWHEHYARFEQPS